MIRGALYIGRKYGRLTVIRYDHTRGRKRGYYLCNCDCGAQKVIQINNVTSGNTKSCGCLSADAHQRRRLPNDGGLINHIILQYKRHAQVRNIPFLLSREFVDKIVRLPCYYCGVVGGNLKRTKNCKEGFAHNGIDRIDSSRPYVEDNCVPACGLCNITKRDMSRDEFIALARRVTEHQCAMADQWTDRAACADSQMRLI
jgi:hypothetical protein